MSALRCTGALLAAAVSGAPALAAGEVTLPPIVAANIEWALSHGLAHYVQEAFGLEPSDGDREATADDHASVTIVSRYPGEAGATALASVAEAWFLNDTLNDTSENATGGEAQWFSRHDLNPSRAFRVLCIADHAHGPTAREAALFAEVPEGGFESCAADRDIATEAWDVLTANALLFDDEPRAEVAIHIDPEGFEEQAEALRRSGILERTREAAEIYAFSGPLTIKVRSCGEAALPRDVEAGTLTLCHELMSVFMEFSAGAEAGGDAGRNADRQPGTAAQ